MGVSSPPLLLKGTVEVAAATVAASQQQQEGRRGEETGGNGSLNSALKQEATPVLSLLCFYRLNFLPARPPLVTTVTIPGAYRRGREGDGKDLTLSLSFDKSSLARVRALSLKVLQDKQAQSMSFGN